VSRAGRIVLGLAVLAILAGAGGCGGGGSACGNNHVDPGEACDDGNGRDDDGCSNACVVQATSDVALQWRILHDVVPGFDESCDGIGATTAKLHLVGPLPGDFEVDCNFSQYKVSAMRAGDYTVTVTLFDAAGMAVTEPASTSFTVADQSLIVPVDIVLADLIDTTPWRGDWFYRFKWNGATTCAAANPPVVNTRIRLDRNGSALLNEAGMAIDGMTPTPCYDFDDQFAHAVNKLPFGPVRLYVTGVDAAGQGRFFGTFDTFVGAGIVNPPLVYDVLAPMTDAGVPEPEIDAGMPDGGEADAGASDAAVPDAS
jgi:cysteine-rich repeat protein